MSQTKKPFMAEREPSGNPLTAPLFEAARKKRKLVERDAIKRFIDAQANSDAGA